MKGVIDNNHLKWLQKLFFIMLAIKVFLLFNVAIIILAPIFNIPRFQELSAGFGIAFALDNLHDLKSP